MAENMLIEMNMKFIEVFNPLYAAPVVAVIFCVLIVYAFGFKSPILPPSFDNLNEEKKFSKKRNKKEVLKQSKLVTNGKVNISSANKVKIDVQKKKDNVDSSVVTKKMNEKSSDKKSAKKLVSQNEKKSPPQIKNENVSVEDFNDDGWVQLVSKKERKYRKKDEKDSAVADIHSSSDIIKHLESNSVSSQKNEELSGKSIAEKKQPIDDNVKSKKNKKNLALSNPGTSASPNVSIGSKPEISQLDKETNASDISKSFENTSRKMEKQQSEECLVTAPITNVTTSKINVPIVCIQESIVPPTSSPKIQTSFENIPPSITTDTNSNIAFDELTDLYPMAKEKKKKKVRRDH